MAAKKKTAKRKPAAKKTRAKRPSGKPSAARRKKTAARKTAAKKGAARKSATKKKTARAKAPARKKQPTRSRPAARKPRRSTATARRSPAAVPVSEATPFTPYVEKRGEEYMNPAQVRHFRGILLNWKRSLMEEVDRTVHHMQDEASNFPDPNDRATQEEEFALELRTRDRERKLIKKIDESLASLDRNDYGFCEICGIEIGIKRLEARPTATLCIDCKTLDEIKEKQMA
jgi:DnaK suppressor protein